eukprot:7337301-Pyramimonas_sp.AAC.1
MGPRNGWDTIGHPGGLTASDQLALWEMESTISGISKKSRHSDTYAGRDAEYVLGEASRGWPRFLLSIFSGMEPKG